MMATNKVSRSEEAFTDRLVYQKQCDRSSSDYLAKLLRDVGSISFGVVGIEIAIADLSIDISTRYMRKKEAKKYEESIS
ncbi:MAG: hypothetical protein V7K35_04525 [Nostoc sp.]|uniref:hypothetical protein n=1 Tax=Nostoc sp. TaxID=1180 RepID=UPI002FFD4E7A